MKSGEPLEVWESTGIDYSDPKTPFVDRFALFCVHFASKNVGIGRIGLRANPFIYRFLDPGARLEICSQSGIWLPVRRQNLRCFPWMAEEFASLSSVEICGRHVFQTGRRMLSRFEFRNLGSEPTVLRYRWRGHLPKHEAVPEQYLAPFGGLEAETLVTNLENDLNGWAGGWKTELTNSSYPQPRFVIHAYPHEFVHARSPELLQGTSASGTGPVSFSLEGKSPLILGPGERHEVMISLEISWQGSAENKPHWDIPFASLMEDARARFKAQIGGGRDLDGEVCRELAPHVWRARHALLRTGFQDADGEFGGRMACLCTSDDQFFSTVFFWDSLFSSAALSGFNRSFARDSILTAFVRQDPQSGSCPENKWNFTVPERNLRQFPQAPVGSWAVSHYLWKNPEDTTFLGEVYPLLLNNHRHWHRFGDSDGDGLAEWKWTGQTADDSPLYDSLVPGGRIRECQWIPPVASVHLNCFLYKDAGLMKDFAKQLGRPEDVLYFEERQSQICSRLMEFCWVPQERRYWDYNHATGVHTRIPTFYMFWPLFAGLPVPEELAEDLISNELLNPERFFGQIPFPSVAYHHPAFDPRGYWRGKAWPHISYWLLETLVRYGRNAEAEQAGERILSWMAARNGFLENMETDPNILESTGHQDYNWGIAAFLLIASKRYLRFTP